MERGVTHARVRTKVLQAGKDLRTRICFAGKRGGRKCILLSGVPKEISSKMVLLVLEFLRFILNQGNHQICNLFVDFYLLRPR